MQKTHGGIQDAVPGLPGGTGLVIWGATPAARPERGIPASGAPRTAGRRTTRSWARKPVNAAAGLPNPRAAPGFETGFRPTFATARYGPVQTQTNRLDTNDRARPRSRPHLDPRGV